MLGWAHQVRQRVRGPVHAPSKLRHVRPQLRSRTSVRRRHLFAGLPARPRPVQLAVRESRELGQALWCVWHGVRGRTNLHQRRVRGGVRREPDTRQGVFQRGPELRLRGLAVELEQLRSAGHGLPRRHGLRGRDLRQRLPSRAQLPGPVRGRERGSQPLRILRHRLYRHPGLLGRRLPGHLSPGAHAMRSHLREHRDLLHQLRRLLQRMRDRPSLCRRTMHHHLSCPVDQLWRHLRLPADRQLQLRCLR